MKFSPRWANLPAAISAEFKRIDQPFEPGFVAVQEYDNMLTLPLLRDMGLYFLQFRIMAGNFYGKFLKRIFDQRGHSVLSTLNYDLLLDQAIVQHQGSIYYSLTSQQPGRTPLLRLHGGPHLAPAAPAAKAEWKINALEAAYFGPASFIDPGEAIDRWRTDLAWAPGMALYAPGKKVVVSPEVIQLFQNQFVGEVAKADVVVVVGVRYLPGDNHIWDAIADAANDVLLVDPLGGAADELAARRLAKPTRHKQLTFEDWLKEPTLD